MHKISQGSKLDEAIAVDIGVRSTALLDAGGEGLKDLRPIIGGKGGWVQRQMELVGDGVQQETAESDCGPRPDAAAVRSVISFFRTVG